MTEWCSCNKLREAQVEIVKTEKALYAACKKLYERVGYCPHCAEERELEYCESFCSTDIDVATCWMDYFRGFTGRSYE